MAVGHTWKAQDCNAEGKEVQAVERSIWYSKSQKDLRRLYATPGTILVAIHHSLTRTSGGSFNMSPMPGPSNLLSSYPTNSHRSCFTLPQGLCWHHIYAPHIGILLHHPSSLLTLIIPGTPEGPQRQQKHDQCIYIQGNYLPLGCTRRDHYR
jgi:hypothetical protein